MNYILTKYVLRWLCCTVKQFWQLRWFVGRRVRRFTNLTLARGLSILQLVASPTLPRATGHGVDSCPVHFRLTVCPFYKGLHDRLHSRLDSWLLQTHLSPHILDTDVHFLSLGFWRISPDQKCSPDKWKITLNYYFNLAHLLANWTTFRPPGRRPITFCLHILQAKMVTRILSGVIKVS